MKYNLIKRMLEEFSCLAKEWEADIALLHNALSSLGAATTQSYTGPMTDYVQQLAQQLATAQQAYGLLQTLQNMG